MVQLLNNKHFGKWITLGVVTTVLAYGGYETYHHAQFAQQVGLPYSEMFESYEHKPITAGKNQNTPNVATEAIVNHESEKKPVIYVMYKVGCETCQENFQSFKTASRNYKGKAPIYWVNTKSDLGHSLIKKYHIQKASTVVLINAKGQYQTYAVTSKLDSQTILSAFNLLEE